MGEGQVKWFNEKKGYGFIQQDEGQDLFVHYTAIQSALAQDSTEAVAANAKRIAAVLREHQTKGIPAAISREAEALAKAESIYEARDAFQDLSRSLIACLKAHPGVPGTYYEFYCPTDKASWLQTSQTPMNPYYGLRAETPTWGWACPAEEKGEFGTAASRKG